MHFIRRVNPFHETHLFTEKTDDAEKRFRFTVWHLHGLREKIKFLEESGFDFKKAIPKIETEVDGLRELIKGDPKLASLDANQQRNVLMGEKSTCPKLEKLKDSILVKAGIPGPFFDFAYRYCSNFVHPTFFTVEQLERINARTGEGLAPFLLINKIASVFMGLGVRDYVSIFPSLSPNVRAEIQEMIKLLEESMMQLVPS